MANEDACKLFVAGLPEAMSEEGLRELFVSSGSNVEELSMPRDRMTGRPRGFAFVRLASSDEADAARATLDGTLVEGRSISVRPFSPEPPTRGERAPGIALRSVTGASMTREPGAPMGGGSGSGGGGMADRMGPPRGPGGGPDNGDRTLYVGNLPYDASDNDVKELFETLGIPAPQRIHLPTDPDGRKRGFGFVTVATAEEAVSSLDKLKEAQVRGRRLVVNIAHPKGDRPAPRPGGGFGGPGGGGGGGFDRGAPGGGGGFGGGPAGGGYGGASGGGGPGGAPGAPGTPDERRRRTFTADDKPGGAAAAFNKAGNKKRRPLEPKNAGKKRGGGGSAGGWEEDDY